MRPYKAAQDITRDETWYGYVYKSGQWNVIRDDAGAAVAFKTWRDAISEAKKCTTP